MSPHQKPNKEVSMNISEDSRLEEFRQLRNTVRGSMEHLIIGIDIAKEKHHAFVGTATGKTLLRKLIFENTREGFEKLSAYVDAVKTRHTLPKAIFGLDRPAITISPWQNISCGRAIHSFWKQGPR
jgi:hypothetical protein